MICVRAKIYPRLQNLFLNNLGINQWLAEAGASKKVSDECSLLKFDESENFHSHIQFENRFITGELAQW